MAEDGWLQGAEGSPARTEYAVKEALHTACAEGLKEQVIAGIGQSSPEKRQLFPLHHYARVFALQSLASSP